jgi:hypothetical protein
VMVSGSKAETTLNYRYRAQQQARLALDGIRQDVHCATAAQAQTISTYPGIKLAVANCFSTTPTVSWCVVPSATLAGHYALWRSTATANTCAASDATKQLKADDLTTNSGVFATSLVNNGLQTVSVDFRANVNLHSTNADVYELTDQLVERNSARCAATGTCTQLTVP